MNWRHRAAIIGPTRNALLRDVGEDASALPLHRSDELGQLAVAINAAAFIALLSALIASQRDFRFLLNFSVQLWMFATPCIYLPEDAYGPAARQWLILNPVFGLVINFRAAVLGTGYPPDFAALGLSAAMAAALFAVALVYFKRVDRTLADTI